MRDVLVDVVFDKVLLCHVALWFDDVEACEANGAHNKS